MSMKTYIVLTVSKGRVAVKAEELNGNANFITFMANEHLVALFPREQVVGVSEEGSLKTEQ